jgi:hypothetical protein
MNDVLARAACDFEDDTRRWQDIAKDIAKDIENEIAITYCGRRVLAVTRHLPRTFDMASAWLTPRASGKLREEFGCVQLQRSLAIRSEASMACPAAMSLLCHCPNHAGLPQRHDHASGDRLRLRLAMKTLIRTL